MRVIQTLLQKKSWRVVALFALGALALLWLRSPMTAPIDKRAEVAEDFGNAWEATRAIGTLDIIYGDAADHTGTPQRLIQFTTEAGAVMDVADILSENILAYNGKTVAIVYETLPIESQYDGVPDIVIQDIDVVALADDAQAAPVNGNTRWVNIACRFGDMTDVTPQPLTYFESLLVNEAPGMDDYWRATSAEVVNIEGSGAFGWYNLPRSKADYMRMAQANVGTALRTLMNDCVSAVQEADGVDFAQYGGINMMLNDTFGCCAWGGRMGLRINGRNTQFRTTWLPPWAFNSLHVIAHEMGHGWGLPHSSGPYGLVYDSAWDVMSGGNSNHTDGICRVGSDPLGCWQVGTIGFHLAMLGWIPDDQMQVVLSGQSGTFTLDALTTLADAQHDLVIFVQIGNSNTFYSVEARTFIDYDRNLPGEAVILHEIVPNRASPAHVVDADNNGNPNDEGAMWLPGETFHNARYGITIEVLDRDGSTFTVRVKNDG